MPPPPVSGAPEGYGVGLLLGEALGAALDGGAYVNDADGEAEGDAVAEDDAVAVEPVADTDGVAPLPGTDADAEADGVNIAGCVDEGELVQPVTTPTTMIVPAAASTFAGNGMVSI